MEQEKKFLVIEDDMLNKSIMTESELLLFGRDFIDAINEDIELYGIDKIDSTNLDEVIDTLNSLSFIHIFESV